MTGTRLPVSSTPEYHVWRAMLARCERPHHPAFKNYGARGITVCERWHEFGLFLADMGPRPTSAHTLERQDNQRGYEPGNCRWATQTEQARNTRRNRLVEAGGGTAPVAAAAEALGLRPGLVYKRLHDGVPEAEALRPSSRPPRVRMTVEVDGDPVLLADLCREQSLNYHRVRMRLRQGWPLASALDTPKMTDAGEKRRCKIGIRKDYSR